jgi:predicted DNA-binding protein
MFSTTQREKVRINIQLPAEIQDRLFRASSRQGKKVSAFVRESIEEKLLQLDRQVFEEGMKAAYQDLAEENLQISENFFALTRHFLVCHPLPPDKKISSSAPPVPLR